MIALPVPASADVQVLPRSSVPLPSSPTTTPCSRCPHGNNAPDVGRCNTDLDRDRRESPVTTDRLHQAAALADAAARDGATHRTYLEELLVADVDARQLRSRERRMQQAGFPRIKTLAAPLPPVPPQQQATRRSPTATPTNKPKRKT